MVNGQDRSYIPAGIEYCGKNGHASTGAIAAAEAAHSSSYRLKFRRAEFLRLVDIANPRVIYRRGKNHLFAFNGFVVFCQECSDHDLRVHVIEAIEFSNNQ